jgi:Na+/H+-dicarboxylate symporter
MSSSPLAQRAARFATPYTRIPLGRKLAMAFVAGAAAGWAMGPSSDSLRPLGDLFILLLRLLVFPIVVSTILASLSSTTARAAAFLGGRVVAVYLATVFAASLAGVAAAALLDPGVGMLPGDPVGGTVPAAGSGRGIGLVSGSLGGAAGSSALLLVTVVTVALALSMGTIRGKVTPGSVASMDRGIEMLQRLTYGALGIVMQYAPVGTFALIAVTIGRAESTIAGHLARLFVAVYLGQAAVVAGLLLLVALVSVPVRVFMSNVKVPLLTAFATGSSAASLPVEIETAGQRLRLDARLVGFALPVGALINKTGTAVHLAVVAALAWNVSGQPSSLESAAAVCMAAFIAAVVTPPISGGSYVVMAGMLQDLGLSLTVIGLVAGVPFLGKLNTPINSLGRLVATQVAARWHDASRREAAPAAEARYCARSGAEPCMKE